MCSLYPAQCNPAGCDHRENICFREHLGEIIANYMDGRWGQLGREDLPGEMRSLAGSWWEQEVPLEHKYPSKKELLPRVPPKHPQQGKDFTGLQSLGVISVIIHTISILSRSVSQIVLLTRPCSWKMTTLCLPPVALLPPLYFFFPSVFLICLFFPFPSSMSKRGVLI